MKNKIIHITAILLLLIFPITAMGMDLSVHKCKHSGNLHFSFSQIDSKKQFDDCCCKPGTKSEAVASDNIKSCCDSDTKQLSKPIQKISEKMTEVSVIHSCCSVAKKTGKNTPEQKETVNSQIIVESANIELNDLNKACENEISKPATCCDISKVAFSLATATLTNISTDKIIKANQFIPFLYLISQIGYQASEKSVSLKINFPLKEPVNKIISFISLQSNQQDDSDSHS